MVRIKREGVLLILPILYIHVKFPRYMYAAIPVTRSPITSV